MKRKPLRTPGLPSWHHRRIHFQVCAESLGASLLGSPPPCSIPSHLSLSLLSPTRVWRSDNRKGLPNQCFVEAGARALCRGCLWCPLCVPLVPPRLSGLLGSGWGRSLWGCCRVPSGWGQSCWSRGASADGGSQKWWEAEPCCSPGSSLNTRWGWQPAHPGAHAAPGATLAQPWCCSAGNHLGCSSASSVRSPPAVTGGIVVVSVCQVVSSTFCPVPRPFAGGTEALQKWLRISPAVLYDMRSCFRSTSCGSCACERHAFPDRYLSTTVGTAVISSALLSDYQEISTSVRYRLQHRVQVPEEGLYCPATSPASGIAQPDRAGSASLGSRPPELLDLRVSHAQGLSP